MKTKDLILNRLALSDSPLSLHEFGLKSISQTSLSARLRELKREGKVISVPVEGKRFTAWIIKPESDYIFTLA